MDHELVKHRKDKELILCYCSLWEGRGVCPQRARTSSSRRAGVQDTLSLDRQAWETLCQPLVWGLSTPAFLSLYFAEPLPRFFREKSLQQISHVKTLLGGVLSGRQEWRSWEGGAEKGWEPVWGGAYWAAHSTAAQSWGQASRQAWNVIPWNSPSWRERELLACSYLSAESCWSNWPQRAWTPLHSRSWHNTPEQKQQKGMASEARNGRRCHRLCGSVR